MTPEIGLTLAILGVAVVLFITEALRVDLVALLMLAALAITGLVTPEEALAGFSSPAVVTVWAVFILSSGLSRTGVANWVGRQVLRIAGKGEARLLIVIMLTAGVLSAFMNNVGVAAMMLPVVLDIARRTGRSPSKLLMPLAFGCLLGGMTTMMGTPPNILVSDILIEYDLRPFGLFDYAPVGVVAMVVGIIYMVLIGRHLLPAHDVTRDLHQNGAENPAETFDLEERLFVIHLPDDSSLAGKTLGESRLGAALSITVVGIMRAGETRLSPRPDERLQAQDRLLVTGRPDRLIELTEHPNLTIEDGALDVRHLSIEDLTSTEVDLAEITIAPGSSLIGQTLAQIDLRAQYGFNVLAIQRDGVSKRTNLQDYPLLAGDVLLVQVSRGQLDDFEATSDFLLSPTKTTEIFHIDERLLLIGIPGESSLAGKTLEESHLRDAYGLAVIGIMRAGKTILMPSPDEKLQTGDQLLVEGKLEDVQILHALQHLKIERESVPDLSVLENETVGMVEVALSPFTTLAGKSLRDIYFRDKYGLNVLAIWRGGRAYRFNLRDMKLLFGDALLVYGPRARLRVLASEPDFLVLTQAIQEPLRIERSPLAAVLMLGTVLSVVLGWLPLSIAAVAGGALMILTGCLKMEEAYRSIEWKAIFLIAGMLPLGIAMQNTGAAQFLANQVVALVEPLGHTALLAGIFLMTVVASQFIPSPALVVLMAPIAITTANDLGISPYALMMLVALASSTNFMSPIGHPANVLVMGPGGYKFSTYTKVGLILTLLIGLVGVFVLPLFWPL